MGNNYSLKLMKVRLKFNKSWLSKTKKLKTIAYFWGGHLQKPNYGRQIFYLAIFFIFSLFQKLLITFSNLDNFSEKYLPFLGQLKLLFMAFFFYSIMYYPFQRLQATFIRYPGSRLRPHLRLLATLMPTRPKAFAYQSAKLLSYLTKS